MGVYLKEIRAENFKSFGKSARIPVMPGYTAVTGPNGCGKSNIFDSILFVIGPKSSKIVRAKKLTDLIFNGGDDKKKGSNFCEVSLIFDNTDRLMPVDTDEVKLTRYIRLSDTSPEGYNSYFYINDKKSSMSEFDAILANARVSADGYNFVQQGDATRLTKISDVERRKVLEDIAGITKFDEDIDRADGKKADVDANMERIRIIMEEIKNSLSQLEKDREGALKRREMDQKLALAKAQLAYKNKARAEEEVKSCAEAIRHAEESLKALEAQKESLTAKLAEVSERAAKVEGEIAAKSGPEARQMKEKIDDLKLRVARASDQIENHNEQIRVVNEEQNTYKTEVGRLKKELADLEAKRDAAQGKFGEKSAKLKAQDAELRRSQEHFAKSDTEVASVQREILVIKQNIEKKEQQLGELRIEADRERDAAQRLTAELAEIEERKTGEDRELADTEFLLNNLKSSIKTSEKGIKEVTDSLKAKKDEETKLCRQIAELEAIYRDKTLKYERMKAEAEAAESVQKGYTTAVGSILEARDRGILKGIHGTIAELATVSKEYETALNIAAGQRMQALVVDTDETAEKAINYLKSKKMGRAAFLPLNKMIDGKPRGKALMVAKEPASAGFAVDLIKFKEEYRAAFWYVLGDTIIMKDLPSARAQMGGVRLVTLDGELIEPAGAIVGGSLGKQQLKFGAPTQTELSKVGGELANIAEDLKKAEERVRKLREEIRVLEGRMNEVGNKTDLSGMKVDELEKKRNDIRARYDKVQADIKDKTAELEKCKSSLEQTEKSLAACESSLKSLREKKDATEKKAMDILPERLQKSIMDLHQSVSSLKDEVGKMEFEAQSIGSQIGVLSDKLKEHTDRMARNDSQIKESRKAIEKNTKERDTLKEELQALVNAQQGHEGKMKGLFDESKKLFEDKTRIEVDLGQMTDKINTAHDDMLSGQTRLKRAEDDLAEIMVEVQGYAPPTAEKLPGFDYLKTTIAECERGIAALGDVNMKALDDYDSQKKRNDELKEETGRLEAEKKDLLALVAELTEKKKTGLYKVFHPINENLKEVYSQLSMGGQAELVMENPDEPFKGGVVMRVKPKDKKTTSILSLSGGEQSLAALAFILSIQQYDPSPFYVLDEVDQNLDAINAERVANYISACSKKAQFIQISLRKATLKEADHIIGVTIQKSGVSEVVMKVNIGEVNEKGEIAGHPSELPPGQLQRAAPAPAPGTEPPKPGGRLGKKADAAAGDDGEASEDMINTHSPAKGKGKNAALG